MAKILVVGNEQNLYYLLEDDLIKRFHYQVFKAKNANEALRLVKSEKIDLTIIKINQDDEKMLKLVFDIRKLSLITRIIIICDKNDEIMLINGLNNGANTYMSEPISLRLLIAQIKAMLNDEIIFKENNDAVYLNENLRLDLLKREAYLNEKFVELSKIEFDLLYYLFQNKNKVISRQDIMNKIWSYNYDKNNRSIDVYIHFLKKKLDLENELINKRSVGYLLKIK